jgi:hypothetical protein
MAYFEQYQRIDTSLPNPFTVRPIQTVFKTNDLLIEDHNARIKARTAMQDMGLYESSKIISPMHLNPGWKWN